MQNHHMRFSCHIIKKNLIFLEIVKAAAGRDTLGCRLREGCHCELACHRTSNGQKHKII